MRRGMTIAASAMLAACSGTGFAELGLEPAPPDAGRDGPADASAAVAPHDAGADADAAASTIDPTPTPTPQSTCVPRDPGADGGLTRCRGSAECPTAMICCGREGDDTGVCTADGSCSAAMPRQLCSASCECVHGTCANAWPYIVYAQCR